MDRLRDAPQQLQQLRNPDEGAQWLWVLFVPLVLRFRRFIHSRQALGAVHRYLFQELSPSLPKPSLPVVWSKDQR